MGRQLGLKLENPTTFRREDLVVSSSNAEAVQAVDAWPNWLGGALAIVGPEGSGKTHMASAWAATSGGQYFPASALRAIELSDLGARSLAIDDADKVDDETLFHLINLAAAEGVGLLVTSRLWPSAWPAKLPDLISRLNALRVVTVKEPDDVVLKAVLNRFFNQRLATPGEDVLDYLVKRIERSVPRARAIVKLIDEAATAEGRGVTVALARKVLEDDVDEA